MTVTANILNGSFTDKMQAYFAEKLGARDLRVKKSFQIMGGISRITWRVDVEWTQPQSGELSMILHLDVPSLLFEKGRKVEYAMYRAFWNSPGVPVPQPLFIENNSEPLGMPFIAVTRADGVSRQAAIHRPGYKEAAPKIARQAFEILGKISAADASQTGLDSVVSVPAVNECWLHELERWEKLIHDSDVGPLPITSAIIRKLRKEPPPPPSRLSVVQGDYHFGNWLFTPQGITAIVDWEMAHLGDPIEDLGWACLQNYRSRLFPDKIMIHLEPDEAVRIWEESSGLKADPEAVKWWTLLAQVRAAAFWVHAANQFASNQESRLNYAILGVWGVSCQEVWMLEDLRRYAAI